jgi:hypothetical protein
MIKVNKKMLERFLAIMDNYDEFVFGTKEQIKKQLEICLNSQGYWSGCSIRVYYDKDEKDFRVESRY